MITPDFAGQYYRDTTTGNIWRSNSTTPGDWSLVVQDMQMDWTPTDYDMAAVYTLGIGYDANPQFPGLLTLVYRSATLRTTDIERAPDLVSVSFPNLTSIASLADTTTYIEVGPSTPSVTTILLPNLVTNYGGLYIYGPTNLTSLDLSSLGSSSAIIQIKDHSLLTSILVDNLVPESGNTNDFRNNALDQTTIDAILHRAVLNAGFVAGSVSLQGGTNATPSASGLADKATLIARGVTVTTN